MFLWLSTFLEVLHCYHRIWRSSHLLQSSLRGFRREIPSVSSARDSEVFLDLSHVYTCLACLAPFCSKTLKSAGLLSMLQSQMGFFLFLRECWKKKEGERVWKSHTYGFSQADRFGLALCICSLAICKGLLLCLWEYAQNPDIGWEESVVWVRCSEQCTCWEDLQVRHPQQLLRRPPDGICDTVSGIRVPLIFCSELCLLFLQLLTGLQLCSLWLSPLNHREKWDSLAASHTAGKARLSVAHRRNHRALLVLSCATLRGKWYSKCKMFGLPFLMYQFTLVRMSRAILNRSGDSRHSFPVASLR